MFQLLQTLWTLLTKPIDLLATAARMLFGTFVAEPLAILAAGAQESATVLAAANPLVVPALTLVLPLAIYIVLIYLEVNN